MTIRILHGDCIEQLRTLPAESVHTCVTSPPYWGLRNYDVEGQIGLEETPWIWLEKMIEVFREIKRVLRSDGTLWINIGDSYANDTKWGGATGGKHVQQLHGNTGIGRRKTTTGLKPKDLMMMPARLALALCDDGWYLRSDIIWAKPNPMPESTKDRPTKSHEHLFLLSKSARYYYDNDAIREPFAETSIERVMQPNFDNQKGGPKDYGPESNRSSRKGVENLKKRIIGTGVGFGHGYDKELKPRQKPAGWATGNDHSTLGWATEKAQGRKSKGGGISSQDYDDRKWEDRHDGVSRPPMTMKDREYNPLGRNKRDVWNIEENHLYAWLIEQPNGSSMMEEYRKQSGNKHDVWTIATQPYSEAHFATFPTKLIEPCILAGCPEGGIVLDPFFGAGTTGLVSDRLQRNCIGIELNPKYADMAEARIRQDSSLFTVIERA